jgi:cyclopropane fatty-acyl-phospholipid synthase-like methyltransferase
LELFKERYHSLSATQAALQEKYDVVNKQHQQFLQENKNKDQLVFELKASRDASGNTISDLESERGLMNEKIKALRLDNEQIMIEKAHLKGELKQLSNLLPRVAATTA